MTRHLLHCLVAVSMIILTVQIGYGQGFGSGSTTQGLFGSNRTLGQGISSLNTTGRTGSPGSNLQQLQANAGQITGNERFLQSNRAPGQFVGADSAEVTNVRSQAGAQTRRAGPTGLGSLNNLLSQLNRGQPNANRTTNSRRTVRAPIRIGFQFTPSTGSAVSAKFQSLLARLPQLGLAGSVSVTMEGRTAILRGAVASEHTRDLVARLAQLEPGISDVRNELAVDPEAAGTKRPTTDESPASPNR